MFTFHLLSLFRPSWFHGSLLSPPPPRPVLSGQHFSCYSVSLFSPLCLSALPIVFVYEKFNSVCIFQLWVPLQCVKFWLCLRVSKHGHSRNRWPNVSSFSSQNLHRRSVGDVWSEEDTRYQVYTHVSRRGRESQGNVSPFSPASVCNLVCVS